ncbi:MAG: hypothetical protein EAS52_03675 [Parapedobacter sp.]|nr:MAG: hypothetical protein EAS52_03675 [Parapedobacter sp.]
MQSSQTLIQSGDKDAVAIFEEYNKIMMPDHPDLSSDDILNILAYIKQKSQGAEEANAAKSSTSTSDVSARPSTYFLIN